MHHIHAEIKILLFRFMRSFDEKDFITMKNCLSEDLFLDYSSFRKDLPKKQSAFEYCEQRKGSLKDLITQHNLSNIIIEQNENSTLFKVYCNFVIYRFTATFSEDKTSFFHSYGQYEFELKYFESCFKICGIIQKVLMSEGNKNIHKGLK